MAPSGAKSRIEANIAAIAVLRKLELEGRSATDDERRALARWGSWGAQGVWQVLDEDRVEFAEQRERLRGLLTDEEFAAARLTTINAHFTDAALVGAVWSAVVDLGFGGGRVLEPGCGAGTFLGMAPDSTELTGVELDPITAAIARHLYPEATVLAESFADTRFPAGHFDLAIGNVPFANVVLHDPRYNPAKLSMHNHFIVKSLEMVRPGGMAAFLTSRWTMDATNPAARRAMANKADLVAAVRLPSRAHWRAAGTEAVTDLLILRRRPEDQRPAQGLWMASSPVTVEGPDGPEQISVNEFWQENPAQVLGTLRIENGMYGAAGLTVKASVALEQVPDQLRSRLAENVVAARARHMEWMPRTQEMVAEAAGWVPAPRDRVDGELLSRPTGIVEVVDGGEVPVKVPKTQLVEVQNLLELRDLTRSVIAAEAASLDDTSELDSLRARLLARWRSYVERFGPINRYSVRSTGRTDSDTGEEVQARITPPAVRLVSRSTYGSLVPALEAFDDVTQTAEPATIMKHRVIVPRQPIQGVETAADGLAVVLDTVGRVDIDRIVELRGTNRADVIAELGPLVFEVPGGADEWQTAAHYLSGNVREKLDEARAQNELAPGRWTANIDALSAVLPKDLGPADIVVRLGAPWIPDSDHEAFLREILNDRHGSVSVVRIIGSDWDVKAPTWSVEATKEWGTDRMPAGRIMGALIAQRKIAVYDRIDNREIYNEPASEAAQEKGRLMQERFAQWLWEDPERSGRLVAAYNKAFNSTVLRDYSTEGDLLTLPGLAKNFVPHRHQRAAVARMINEPCVGLFHAVGAGKTAEMAMGATELRRLGLIHKPAVVVPNHMLAQFSREWLQLYPQAKILAASSDDLSKDRRRRFVAQVATNDWDAVIMTQTAFLRLKLSPDAEAAYQEAELAAVRTKMQHLQEQHGAINLKRLEKAVLSAEQQLQSLRDVPADPGVSFEETGIDYLIVDELHLYKNLRTTSAIPDAAIEGSARASDLHAKVEYLRRTQGERVFTGATATPVANSITEMYVLQRYMDPAALAAAGIEDFDVWAATFGELVTAPELAVAGGGRFKIKQRFSKFVNLPELLTMFHRFGDVQTAEDLDLPRPQIVARESDGQRAPRLLLVPPTPELKDYVVQLGERSDRIAARQVEASEDNPLVIASDGRKAALAMRLVNPLSTDTGKVDAAADELVRIWLQTKDRTYLDPETGDVSPVKGALQIVFCDLSTPDATRWNVYDELKAGLVARGMPAANVKFVHEAKSDAQKAHLFAEARSGRVSVLVGSTAKMGVGTNIQSRAVHLMDLDAPWRPADVEQRHGRILRQGNQHPEVHITQVVTEGSFDAYMWQTLERKARFIDQLLSGRLDRRETEDLGENTLNATEIKAIASGNPLLLEHAAASQELHRLTVLERAHANSERSLANTIKWSNEEIGRIKTRIEALVELEAATVSTAGDQFSFHLAHAKRTTRDRADAAAALNRAVRYLNPGQTETIGTLGGHEIEVSADAVSKNGKTVVSQSWRLAADRAIAVVTIYEPGVDQARVEVGTVLRLEHLVASIPSAISRSQARIDELAHTVVQSERIIGQPFRHASALDAAREKYEEISRRMAEIQEQQPAIDSGSSQWESVDAQAVPAPPVSPPVLSRTSRPSPASAI